MPIARLLPMAVLVLVASVATAAERPMNLLVIGTDEHHYGTLGCYGGKIVGTPHIDAIAEAGALCTSFYANTPVCSPSRGSLVSGLYPQATPVTTNNIPLSDDVVTFAEILKRRGYATGYAGKWHLDGDGKPQWAPERKFGFDDNRFMFNRGHWKKFEDTPEGPRVGARKNGKPTYGVEGADEKTFATDWLADKVVGFVDEHHEKPFCYMLSLPDPHGPNTVRPPYDTMYADVNVPIPASLVRKPDQVPAWGKPAGVTAAQLRRLMTNYYGMVKCIDDNVGKIVAALEKHDLLDHTIIVFTADHGDLCGEHGRLNKGVPYEGSARIPFLITCPGKIEPGTVVDESLSNVDFLPTVMNLLGVSIDHDVHGRDVTPVLTNSAKDWNDVTFIRSTGRPTGNSTAWISAVTARYKLVYSTEEEPWLLDLDKDPNELENVFGHPENRELVRKLTKDLAEYGRAYDDEYVRIPRIKAWMQQGLGN